METLKLIIEIGLIVLLIMNVTKEIFWGKKHKDYLEATSAKEVLPNIEAQKKIIEMISDEKEMISGEKIKLQEKYELAQKEIESLKEAYQMISSGKELKAGDGPPKIPELNFGPAMNTLNEYQQTIGYAMA